MADKIMPLLQAVKTCVCNQLITDGRPVCECCILTSQELPPMDACDCDCAGDAQGRAWARFIRATPTESGLTKLSRCSSPIWAAEFQVGVYRCVSDTTGNCEDLLADATKVYADASSLVKAVTCCSYLSTPNSYFRIDRVETVGPVGLCVGVAVAFTVQMMTL